MSQEALTEVDMDVFSRRISPYFSWLESRIESGWESTNDNDVLRATRELATTMRARFILGVSVEEFKQEVERVIALFEMAADCYTHYSDEIDAKLVHMCKGIAEELGSKFVPGKYGNGKLQEPPRPEPEPQPIEPEPPRPQPGDPSEPEPSEPDDDDEEDRTKVKLGIEQPRVEKIRLNVKPHVPLEAVKQERNVTVKVGKPRKTKKTVKKTVKKAKKKTVKAKVEPSVEKPVKEKTVKKTKQATVTKAKKGKKKPFILKRWFKYIIYGEE